MQFPPKDMPCLEDRGGRLQVGFAYLPALAIPAAAAEIPVNPKSAAMIATTRKIIAHLSIMRLTKN